jgi:hypothetical protein
MTNRKHYNKALKAVYFIHLGVNTLNEFGLYDIRRAERKVKSHNYHFEKAKN